MSQSLGKSMRSNINVTYNDLRQDYYNAKALGAAKLACMGMLVPRVAPEMRLLITAMPKPIVTNNDVADTAYAGGLQSHQAGIPKTSYQGSVTFLETETGKVGEFAELIVANSGICDCDFYDGRYNRFVRVHELLDVAFTFEPGDIQADSRSQVLNVTGSIQYMYFGLNAGIGGGTSSNSAQQAIDGVGDLLNRAQQIINVGQQAVGVVGSIARLF